jgi:hypothetical protein
MSETHNSIPSECCLIWSPCSAARVDQVLDHVFPGAKNTRAIRREHALTKRDSSQTSSSSVPTSSMGLLERFKSTLSASVSRCGHPPPPYDNNCRSGGTTCFRYLTISWQRRHSILHKFQQSVVRCGLSPIRDMTYVAIQLCMLRAPCRDETYVPDRCYFAHAAVYVCIAEATSSFDHDLASCTSPSLLRLSAQLPI